MSQITEKIILDELAKIKDPILKQDLVTLNQVGQIKIKRNTVELELKPVVPRSPFQERLEYEITNALTKYEGIKKIKFNLNPNITTPIPKAGIGPQLLPKVKNIIAVASNKGGVGKSTVSVNIAAALKILGAKVAVLDLDIYGPNIPNMFGIEQKPMLQDQRIKPIKQYDIPLMSVGFMIEHEATPIILRAPIVNKIAMTFFQEVEWDDTDYMVVDLPPGTGDIQLTLAQQLPNARIFFVTTPQDISLADVYKGVRMFQQKEIKLPILGVVENMSYFICDNCEKRHEIFDHGGGARVAETFDLHNFGEIPIVQKIREQGDEGKPITLTNPDHPISREFIRIAEEITIEVARQNHEINKEREKQVFVEIDLK
ncbi:MAG: Mrp/NBP35 family ATP-binding protein [Candidatus Hodarchaeales archaeon]|jgi:ATP-binding protein involved in chromosome partitioning